jgi:hypothetical protein
MKNFIVLLFSLLISASIIGCEGTSPFFEKAVKINLNGKQMTPSEAVNECEKFAEEGAKIINGEAGETQAATPAQERQIEYAIKFCDPILEEGFLGKLNNDHRNNQDPIADDNDPLHSKGEDFVQ